MTSFAQLRECHASGASQIDFERLIADLVKIAPLDDETRSESMNRKRVQAELFDLVQCVYACSDWDEVTEQALDDLLSLKSKFAPRRSSPDPVYRGRI